MPMKMDKSKKSAIIQDSELDIIKKIRIGDQYAFRDLFKKHYSSLVKSARRYVGNTQIAEDIVEDVFLNIWKKRTQLNINTSVKAYLFSMVRNHALNHVKRKKLEETDSFYLNITIPSNVSADQQVTINELTEHIQKAIAELPERTRCVFTMHRYDNLKYSEIAEVLKIAEGTVETHMVRALKFLRKRLAFLLSTLILLNKI
jgi:RNA polymerase sigma-70 factor (ECF subfamily)